MNSQLKIGLAVGIPSAVVSAALTPLVVTLFAVATVAPLVPPGAVQYESVAMEAAEQAQTIGEQAATARDEAVAQRDALIAERDALAEDALALADERDALSENLADERAINDDLAAENARVLTEYAQLQEQVEQLQSALDAAAQPPSEPSSGTTINPPNLRSPVYCSWSFRGGFNCGVRG